jgi:hypothetical protein
VKGGLAIALACGLFLPSAAARAREANGEPPAERSLAEVSAKLSNPVSDLWAINMQVGINFSDGELNQGAAKAGGFFQMQPALPIPLYEGERTWRMILRPTIPVRLGAPIPTGFDEYDHETGLSDMLLPFLFAPALDHWILGGGPGFLFPTSTEDELGRRQWGLGPAVVVGYKTKQWTAIVFPNYIWRIADRGDQDATPDASFLTLQYAFNWNLPNAWQVGINNTASYDHRASSGNKWNVPIGPFVSKTVRFGSTPVKFQLSAEYSVVSQDDFGQRGQVKFTAIPVIPGLIQEPVLGRHRAAKTSVP